VAWVPFVAISRTAAVAIHSGIPWAASLAAETPAISGGEIIQAATTALNLGVLGLVFWLLIQGRLHTDSENDRLVAELNRAVAEKDKAEEQLSEALRFARDDLAPMLLAFNASVSALLPILQELVRHDDRPAPRRRSREIP
jgi:citrate synthase